MLQVSEPNPRTTGGEVSGILVLRMPCSRYVGVVGFGVYHPISAVGFLVGCFSGVFLWGFQCRQNHNQNHRSPPLGPMEAVVIGAGGGKRPGITRLVAPNDRPDPGGVALGDRRSGVQISAARQTRTSTTSHEVESSVSSSPSNQHGRLPARANAARSAGVIQATVSSDGYMKLLGSVEWPTPKMWASSCSTLS